MSPLCPSVLLISNEQNEHESLPVRVCACVGPHLLHGTDAGARAAARRRARGARARGARGRDRERDERLGGRRGHAVRARLRASRRGRRRRRRRGRRDAHGACCLRHYPIGGRRASDRCRCRCRRHSAYAAGGRCW